jgi:hypothetical protein
MAKARNGWKVVGIVFLVLFVVSLIIGFYVLLTLGEYVLALEQSQDNFDECLDTAQHCTDVLDECTELVQAYVDAG